MNVAHVWPTVGIQVCTVGSCCGGRGTAQGGIYEQKLFFVIKHSSILDKIIVEALLVATWWALELYVMEHICKDFRNLLRGRRCKRLEKNRLLHQHSHQLTRSDTEQWNKVMLVFIVLWKVSEDSQATSWIRLPSIKFKKSFLFMK